MWTRRLTQGIALLPLALLVACDAQHRPAQEQRRPEAKVLLSAPRPVIVRRSLWHADERAVHEKPEYTGTVKIVFVHHTEHPDTYDCRRDVPDMLRNMQYHHIRDLGWNDLGYNFVVDRCGNIYEGRAGGVDKAVRGAHTEGFNAESVGIAALGSFTSGEAPRPMLEAIAALAAWKLSPGVDPKAIVRVVSTNDESRYPKGTAVRLNAISGHRDGFETACPGDVLYDALPRLREMAEARLRPEPRRRAAATPGG